MPFSGMRIMFNSPVFNQSGRMHIFLLRSSLFADIHSHNFSHDLCLLSDLHIDSYGTPSGTFKQLISKFDRFSDAGYNKTKYLQENQAWVNLHILISMEMPLW